MGVIGAWEHGGHILKIKYLFFDLVGFTLQPQRPDDRIELNA